MSLAASGSSINEFTRAEPLVRITDGNFTVPADGAVIIELTLRWAEGTITGARIARVITPSIFTDAVTVIVT